MGFKTKLCFRYSTTHENRIWNKLVDILTNEFSNRSEEIFLIGNLMVDGRELDALVVKEDAVVVVDFKDYGGVLTISENQPWTASGVNVNSSRKNPFAQLSDNKYAVLNILKNKLPEGFENWINIGHINALVMFHQPIDYDISNLKYDLSASASRWFHVCDIEHVVRTIDEITSSQTSLKGQRAGILFDALGISDILEAEQQLRVEDLAPKIDSQFDDEESLKFSDLYYSKARCMESIQLLIVGQDPYPTNPNGVAFCKNSYYELFQEDCSGGIVLKSLGLDKEKSREVSRKNPKNLFYKLLTSHGICFINVFNKTSDQLSVEDTKAAAEEARDFNMPIIEKSKTIVLLGKGRTRSTFEKYYPSMQYHHVLIHPSPKAKVGSEEEWTETWETQKLFNILELAEK